MTLSSINSLTRAETSSRSPRSSSAPPSESDPGSDGAVRARPSLPGRLFGHRPRAVAPAASTFFDDNSVHAASSLGDLHAVDDDPNSRDIIFVNKPSEFDLRSMLFGPTTSPTTAVVHGEGHKPGKPHRRRLRAKEELCLTLPRSGSRPKRSWFMSPGLIGRDGGDHILVATKDPSMDPVHAELSVEGDDYLLRDHHSVGGTFLCLTTVRRHYPQRDGFRLRRGDTFYIGLNTKVCVEELVTEPVDAASKLESDASADSDNNCPPQQEEVVKPSRPQRSSDSRRSSARRQSALAIVDERDGEGESPRVVVGGDGEAAKPPLHRKASSSRRRVRFVDTPPLASDGSVVLGSRYQRTKSVPRPRAYPLQRPVSLTLAVSSTLPDAPPPEVVQIEGKELLLIGSAPTCDVSLTAEDVHPVHARIVFDGFFFVLQDLSFDDNPRRKTRVFLANPTRLARGDTLLFGDCELHVTTPGKAFRGRDQDMKEVAVRCRVLRVSKRQTRAPARFVTIGYRHRMAESFVFGKGRDCHAQMFTTALAVEQFAVQLDHGTCMMTPKASGINQGTYFLLGRDSMPHATDRTPDLVRYSSKALMLVEGCVFKCGNSEFEVVYVKSSDGSEDDSTSRARAKANQVSDEVLENTELLGNLPWLQQIAFDKRFVQNIARRGRRLNMEPGDVIYDEGDPATFLFIVVDGDVELLSFRMDADGEGDGQDPNDRILMRRASLAAIMDGNDPDGKLGSDIMTEQVTAGSYFGEICLQGPGMEYTESARAVGDGCCLLVFDREDLAGYLNLYMDIIQPHLPDETQREVLQKLRLHVPWMQGLSYHDLRLLASRAERVEFAKGEQLLEDGLFRAPFRREGLLILMQGRAVLTRRRRLSTVSAFALNTAEPESDQDASAPGTVASDGGDGEETDGTMRNLEEWWQPTEPLALIRSAPSVVNAQVSCIEARTHVECFLLDAEHIAHLAVAPPTPRNAVDEVLEHNDVEEGEGEGDRVRIKPLLLRQPTNRRSSYAAMNQRLQSSQIITKTLHAAAGDDDEDGDAAHGSANGGGGDSDNDDEASRKWRRKKRNKNVLEKTLLEAQQDDELPNALVLYVLSGANRGDVHVVRNVATLGAMRSGADIELNDRYVSSAHAVIEHHDGRYWLYDDLSEWGTFVRLEENTPVEIHPGDVFLAGEIEFTSLGAFPERKKPMSCCIQ